MRLQLKKHKFVVQLVHYLFIKLSNYLSEYSALMETPGCFMGLLLAHPFARDKREHFTSLGAK